MLGNSVPSWTTEFSPTIRRFSYRFQFIWIWTTMHSIVLICISSITLLTWMKILLIYSRVNETRIRIFHFKYVLHWWIVIMKMAWANQQLIFLIWSLLETEQVILALTHFNGASQLINQWSVAHTLVILR